MNRYIKDLANELNRNQPIKDLFIRPEGEDLVFECHGQTKRVLIHEIRSDAYEALKGASNWARGIISQAQQNQAALESERANRAKRHRSANLRIKKALRRRCL